jgi:hypothetical protein
VIADPALYAALAEVAAITTALQGAVAIQPLGTLSATRERKRASDANTQQYNDAKADAQKGARTTLLMNLPAVLVNGAVLASWGRVAISASAAQWEYWVPWLAVIVASAFLFFVALATGLKLRTVGSK